MPRNTSPDVARAHARLAITKRHHPDADHSELERDLREAVATDYIRRLVDAAPPLSDAQRARLAALLAPSTQDGTAA